MIRMENCGTDLEEVCRSCMRVCSEMRSVFDKEISDGQPTQLSDMIMACTDVQVREDDGLPSHLCSKCEVKLQTAFTFKKQCEKSDAIFRAISSVTHAKIDIKQEYLTLGKVVIKEECLENLDVIVKSDINNDCTTNDDNYVLDLVCANQKRIPKRDFSQDKDEMTCNYCYKAFHTKKGLKIHMRRHTGGICSASLEFAKSHQLSKHKKTQTTAKNQEEFNDKDEQNMSNSTYLGHGSNEDVKERRGANLEQLKNEKVMECEFCDKRFKYKKSFQHHMQLEHGMSNDNNILLSSVISMKGKEEENSLSTVPTVEGNTDSSSNNKVMDLMIVSSVVLPYKCDRCDKAFASEEHLTKHTEEEHLYKPYICTICNKNFARGDHLIRHVRVHETAVGMSILSCSLCEKVFDRSDDFACHVKVHLKQDKPHVCSECGKAYNRLDNLKTHQRIHSGIKDNSKLHLCIYCGKEFNSSSNMIVHMRRHTGERPYKCDQCGKGFPRSVDLKCHERTHSGEKPYLCTLCGKSFNKSSKLLRHSRVHTGERPHVCNLCGRSFIQSSGLTLHMRKHTGSRPYICGVCPARFIQSGQLKNHRLTTGHWMETQPELKGGHRVEPVTPITKPAPIKFKTHGKSNTGEKIEKEDLVSEK